MVVSLWNQHAQSFDADRYMEMASRAPVAFLFVGMTCRIFEEKLTLQGSTLCKWYANPELPEAAALQDSCAGQLLPPTWFGPTAAQMEPERITMTQLSLFTNPHIIYIATGTLSLQKSNMRFLISHGGTMLVTSATKHCSPMETNISVLVLSVLEQQEGLGIIFLLLPLTLTHQQSSKVRELSNLCSLGPQHRK